MRKDNLMGIFYDQEFLTRLERLTFTLRHIKAGKNSGNRRSPIKGHSVEFADFRGYSRGDDMRYIDWNSYARTEKLFVKLFLEEQDLLLNIFIDTSESMKFGHPSKAELAKQVAGALAYMGLASYDQVAVAGCSNHLNGLRPLRGKSAVNQVWHFIDNLNFSGITNLDLSLCEFGRYSHHPGLSLVISDFISNNKFREGTKYLRYLNQDVILLQILSPEELKPELRGDWRLLDSETGEILEVNINTEILKAYQRKLKNLNEEIRKFCLQQGIIFLSHCSDESFEDIILRSLPAAGILE
ncbi:MAG: DUF58 domain-containing protein [Syntrophomonadaceae bacterium]|nr:DUF58 domain-containing protein [Syntrophomonadaceae bacterium]MDD3888378.1 DUF58 domain-containing protein [Syntrophomonadaceae bacterium]MDD4548883.1 DUF58 domain-containing protein [Syntrophomonadaceae bacterium]